MDNNLFYNKDLDYFYDLIKNNEPLKYSRFNDGEFISILNSNPDDSNCDGHKYFPSMGEELKKILINYKYKDTYILELFKQWYDTIPHIRNTVSNLKNINNELCFVEKDFIRISHEQESRNFIKLLKLLLTKNLVIVGPYYLKDLLNFKHIEVPLKNSYLEINNIINDIKKLDAKSDNLVFLISMGLPTGIVIDYFKNSNNIYIDWGSVWDTFFVSERYNFIKKRSTSNKQEVINNYMEYLR